MVDMVDMVDMVCSLVLALVCTLGVPPLFNSIETPCITLMVPILEQGEGTWAWSMGVAMVWFCLAIRSHATANRTSKSKRN